MIKSSNDPKFIYIYNHICEKYNLIPIKSLYEKLRDMILARFDTQDELKEIMLKELDSLFNIDVKPKINIHIEYKKIPKKLNYYVIVI